MKVLIYGGGAREHALAWKIKQSPLLEKLYLYKPNDGFAALGEVINAENNETLAKISKEKNIDLLVVGPEDPLVAGIVDEFKKVGIPAIGADKKWAMLEGSKAYAKEFMQRNNIPTAKYEAISSKKDLYSVLEKFTIPVVLKADGLAAGKGVYIATSRIDAEMTLKEFLEGKFGEASGKVIVEEFLEGPEISLISLWDGNTLLPFIPARDYKKLNDGNQGPNTGGMGAYCPVSLTADEYKNIEEYLKKLEQALKNEQADFTGVIYSGLILTPQGIKVLEYNMRFGDPETQPLLMHLDSDLLKVFKMAVNKELDKVDLKWKKGQSFCVVVAADGYPENPKKGGAITNVEQIIQNHGVNVFFAGVKKEGNNLVASGGRVLSICQSGPCAQKYIYDALLELDFSDKVYRKDIGEVSLQKKDCTCDYE
ncbi:MAG: phosphoribosylamine--glycine ligase [Candidatus Melainabacteria bacterium GWF2_37_15]|nr:MAG: phosphoribosylamine--glycine ligase [Candidatus Melainabacteria bacterium GWF2_37_15]